MKKGSVARQGGFTLVELLVVIAIIAILTTVLMVNFSGVRQRNRDTKRKADLKDIQTGVEFYRTDKGAYPPTLPTCGNALTDPMDATIQYMKKVPCDPSSTTSTTINYTYAPVAGTNNLQYTLTACLENTKDGDRKVGDNSCGATKAVYQVLNP